MTHLTDLDSQALQTIFYFLEWSHLVSLLSTRDSRIFRILSRTGALKSIVFNQELDEELPLALWLLRGTRGLESVTLRSTLGGAQRLLPSLASHDIKRMVIDCPLHDGVQKPGMKRFMSPHFVTSSSRGGTVVVPSLSSIFPSLQHLCLTTPIPFLFSGTSSSSNNLNRGLPQAPSSVDYPTQFFATLRDSFLSLELDYSQTYCFLTPQAIHNLPPTLTKLHLKSKIDTHLLQFNLYLSALGATMPELMDLEIRLPYSSTCIDVDDERRANRAKEMGGVIDNAQRPVHRCLPPHLTRLSLCLGTIVHYATIVLPEHLESLSLSSMLTTRTCPLVFGLGNFISPVLPQSLKELNLRQFSIMSGNSSDWDRRVEGSLIPINLPASVTRFGLSQGDFSPVLSFRSVWPTLLGLRYLTVYDPEEGDKFRYSNLSKTNWAGLPNLLALDIGSTPISSDRVHCFPETLTSLKANYDSFRTLAELVSRLQNCRFGRCRFPLYTDDLTAIYQKALTTAGQNGNSMPNIQSEMDLMRYCTQMLESRVDHVDLQFSADKPVVQRAGEYHWAENQVPIHFGPCEPTDFSHALFLNPATYRTSRVSLHTHFFNPSLYTFNGLTTLVFETKTPLTSKLMSSLPNTLVGFNSMCTPIHEEILELNEVPAGLEFLSIGFSPLSEVYATFGKFRKPQLETLQACHIMFDPADLASVFSSTRSLETLEFMMSDKSHDDSLLALANELRDKRADWKVYGTIFLSGRLVPYNQKVMDYNTLLDSAKDAIDSSGIHTSHALWRPAPTLYLPASVQQVSLDQQTLLEMSPTMRASLNSSTPALSSPTKSVNAASTASKDSATKESPLSKSASRAVSTTVTGKDSLTARCPIIVALSVTALHINSTHALDLLGYLICLPSSLRQLSLEVPVTFVRDMSLWKAQVSQISQLTKEKTLLTIPESLEAFELSNTDPTTSVNFELAEIPRCLSTLVLRDNCRLIPPHDPYWSHAHLIRLQFPGGSPWTDAQALALQTGLPRDARISIGVLGFTGVLSNRAALHMTWNTMLKDAMTALPRVTVGVFDLNITSRLSLDLAKSSNLRSLHLDPNSLEKPIVVRSERSTIEFLPQSTPNKRAKLTGSASTSPQLKISPTKSRLEKHKTGSIPMAAEDGDEDFFDAAAHWDEFIKQEGNEHLVPDIDEPPVVTKAEEAVPEPEIEETPESYLVHADTFHLLRLPNPLPRSLQELEIYNNDEFFPHFRLDHVQNLFMSHLIRLVLNVPIRVHQRFGDLLPRTLVTLSLPKATEEPSGLPSRISSLPPKLMYLNLPQLLVHRASVTHFPSTLKLLKTANSEQIYRSLLGERPELAHTLFPNGATDTPAPVRPNAPPQRAQTNATPRASQVLNNSGRTYARPSTPTAARASNDTPPRRNSPPPSFGSSEYDYEPESPTAPTRMGVTTMISLIDSDED